MMESTPLLSSATRVAQVLNERQEALKEPGVGHAACLIKDAVTGRQDAPFEGYYNPYLNKDMSCRNMMSVIGGRLVIQLDGWVKFACWILFLLTFFEPPKWCRDASHIQSVVDDYYKDAEQAYSNISSTEEYGDCKILLNAHGTTADLEENQQLYPNSGTMWLTISQSKIIELTCVFVITMFMILRFADDGFDPRLFFYSGYKRLAHSIQCLVLVGLLVCTVVEDTTYNPFLRMLILGSFLRRMHRELRTFLKMIPKLMIPLSMLAIIVFFYAWFGVVMFYNSPQGIAAFPNLAEGMWTLWICITTANYPDVNMPSYNEDRKAVYFFVSFMLFAFFYMMNIVLAVACNAYDESIEERKSSRAKLAKDLLIEAYTLLDHDDKNSVSRDSIMRVMTILNQDIPEVESMSEEEKRILFAFLDKDGDNTISRDEFMEFGSIFLISLEKGSAYATFVEIYLPSVFSSDFYQTLCKSVKSAGFEKVIDVVLVLNAGIVLAQDYPLLAGQDVSGSEYREGAMKVYETAETIFTVLYVSEAILKIMVNGWKKYRQLPRNVYDFIITLLVVLASAYVYYPNAYDNHAIIEFIVMARVLRLGRLLFRHPNFRSFGLISLEIIPAAASVFTLLLFIGYFFAALGMLLYGGKITRDPSNPFAQSLLEAEGFVANEYWANNFNDMSSGMNVLFNWLVVNNWTTMTSGMEHAISGMGHVTESKWLVRLFFFSFYLLGVIGIGNVITSFIINAFFQKVQTIEDRQGPDEVVKGGEATIRGSRAVFTAAQITGTDTGVRDTVFFAHIKPKHMDVELDERSALKRLFSGKADS